jgi:phosphoribosylformylglycinamidine synthase
VKNNGQVVAEIPNHALTDEAPMYRRPMATPAYLEKAQRLDLDALGAPPAPREVFRRLLASPGIASKRWVYRQYDHMVRTNTLLLPGMGAAVVRVKETPRALAMSVDCNGRFTYLDRRSADRRHQLPELRQPREARDHVAIRSRG